jgi:hypothetical protein
MYFEISVDPRDVGIMNQGCYSTCRLPAGVCPRFGNSKLWDLKFKNQLFFSLRQLYKEHLPLLFNSFGFLGFQGFQGCCSCCPGLKPLTGFSSGFQIGSRPWVRCDRIGGAVAMAFLVLKSHPGTPGRVRVHNFETYLVLKL